MPPRKVASLGDQAVGACRRQPVEAAHIVGRQANAVGDPLRPVGIVPAAPGNVVIEFAADIGEIDFARVLVLELLQAAAPAAVAKALPFGGRHLSQAFAFPKQIDTPGDSAPRPWAQPNRAYRAPRRQRASVPRSRRRNGRTGLGRLAINPPLATTAASARRRPSEFLGKRPPGPRRAALALPHPGRKTVTITAGHRTSAT